LPSSSNEAPSTDPMSIVGPTGARVLAICRSSYALDFAATSSVTPMAVRTMYVTDTYQNEPTAYMPTVFAPSDATTAASIVHRAHRSPRRTAKCTNAKDAMPMPTRLPPRACSKWTINDVVAAGTSAVRQVADTAKRDRSRHHVQDEQAGTPHPVTVPPLALFG
jgi:hypothetical protein